MFSCKITPNGYLGQSYEYSVTTDENCIDIKNNIISADSRLGKKLYDYVNSQIDNFLWDDITYKISDVIRCRYCDEMKRYNSSEGKKIRGILNKNKVKYLVHFTNIENLSSILEYGILSVEELEKRRIDYINNDFSRYDGKKQCSCFSVEFPNISLYNSFTRKQSDAQWVVLLVEAEVLIISEGDKYFCVHNAASSSIRKKVKVNQLQKPEDFENMFFQNIEYSKRCGKYVINRTVEKSYLTTSGQAEILIEGEIHKENIKGIISNSLKAKDKVDVLLRENGLNDVIDSIKEKRYFIDRNRVKFKKR